MASAHPLIDHDDIRTWAEARHAQPACVKRTGGKGDPGMIRLEFPGFSGNGTLAPEPPRAARRGHDGARSAQQFQQTRQPQVCCQRAELIVALALFPRPESCPVRWSHQYSTIGRVAEHIGEEAFGQRTQAVVGA
jgi:hypothetical protein